MTCYAHRNENGRPTCFAVKHNVYVDNVLNNFCDTDMCPFFKPKETVKEEDIKLVKKGEWER